MSKAALADRVVLVTNVAHFVGLPAAEAMAEQGATVYCHDASFAVDDSRGQFADAHPALRTTGAQKPADIAQAVLDGSGRIDVLVNNDAFPAIRAPLETASVADLRTGMESLLVFPFMLCQAVVPQMKDRRAGKLLFVTSAAPLRGIANYSMYAAARGGANALAICLARELAPHNIQVNAFAPNYVESPTYFPPELLADPESLKKITSTVPLGRLAKPEEAGAVVAFLASEQSDFMTGLVLPFAGGWA